MGDIGPKSSTSESHLSSFDSREVKKSEYVLGGKHLALVRGADRLFRAH